MASSSLCKIILATTLVAFILYVVGFASPNWLQKEFELNVLGIALGLPAPLDALLIKTQVKSNMGLLKSCSDNTYLIPQNTKQKTDCSSDGAADWQLIAAGLSIAALVLSFGSLTLWVVGMFVTKLQGSKLLRPAALVINLITAGLMLSSLVLYGVNKKIQVSPALPDQIDYDLSWAFYITAVSAVLFTLLVPLNCLSMLWNNPANTGNVGISKEPSVVYNK